MHYHSPLERGCERKCAAGCVLKNGNLFYSFSERSGKKNNINVEITGKTNPITNHILGSRPKRFANRDVIIGMLSMNMIPMLMNNNAAPILQSY
jgi:hypothetical protein